MEHLLGEKSGLILPAQKIAPDAGTFTDAVVTANAAGVKQKSTLTISDDLNPTGLIGNGNVYSLRFSSLLSTDNFTQNLEGRTVTTNTVDDGTVFDLRDAWITSIAGSGQPVTAVSGEQTNVEGLGVDRTFASYLAKKHANEPSGYTSFTIAHNTTGSSFAADNFSNVAGQTANGIELDANQVTSLAFDYGAGNGDVINVKVDGVQISATVTLTGTETESQKKEAARDAILTAIQAQITGGTILNGASTGEVVSTKNTTSSDTMAYIRRSVNSANTAFTVTDFTKNITDAAVVVSTTQAASDAVKQIDTVTIGDGGGTVVAGDSYSIDIDGTTITTGALVGGETADDIRDTLIGLINANGAVNGTVNATVNGSGEIKLESDTAGVAYTLSNLTSTVGSISTANVQLARAVAQQDTVTVTAGTIPSGGTFSIDIGGTTVTTGGLSANASAADVSTAIVTAITAAGIGYTAATSGTDGFIITANTAGTAGAFTTNNLQTTGSAGTLLQETLVELAGATISTTVSTGTAADESTIQSALVAAINANATLSPLLTASNGAGVGEVDIEANVAGRGFSIDLGLNSKADAITQATIVVSDPYDITGILDHISTMMAGSGAELSRLNYTRDQLKNAESNLGRAHSAIVDTDVAAKMLRLSRLKIMMESGASILSQSNMLTSNVLQLLLLFIITFLLPLFLETKDLAFLLRSDTPEERAIVQNIDSEYEP